MDTHALSVLGAQGTLRAYTQASVKEFFLAAGGLRSHLLAQLAKAHERKAEADARLLHDRELHQRIGAMVLDAQRTLAEEQRETDRSIAAIVGAAEAKAEQILAAAREEVASLKGVLHELPEAGEGDVAKVMDLVEQWDPLDSLRSMTEAFFGPNSGDLGAGAESLAG